MDPFTLKPLSTINLESTLGPKVTVSGDVARAKQYIGFAHKQLGILDAIMGIPPGYFETPGAEYRDDRPFNMNRSVKVGNGVIVSLWRRGPQNGAHIYVPPPGQPQKPQMLYQTTECWCTCCFAQAQVLEVLGEYESSGPGILGDSDYPVYCSLTDIYIQYYQGIRYRILVCQDLPTVDDPTVNQSWYSPFIAASSDFTNFVQGDNVIAMFRGNWQGNDLDMSGCQACAACIGACQALKNPNMPDNRCDGSFMLLPLEVDGVTLYADRN